MLYIVAAGLASALDPSQQNSAATARDPDRASYLVAIMPCRVVRSTAATRTAVVLFFNRHLQQKYRDPRIFPKEKYLRPARSVLPPSV